MSAGTDPFLSWAVRAAEALQEVCDAAQEAAGNPDGEDQCPDLRALLADLDGLFAGLG